ncbi:MAG: acyl carrier protein [Pseudobutyrivibrio sp.]|nr:acyl carrier protein [Pseudobutyrivibrio sp.]
MTNLEKYEDAFIKTFNIKKEELEELEYQSIEGWDSVGHMGLIEALEDTFDIMMDADDIIDFSSYKRGKEIIKKYSIEL